MLKNKGLWINLLILIILFTACSKDTTKEVETKEVDKITGPPSVADLDKDDPMTPYIEHGEKAFNETNTVLPDDVGNELSCMSCHADGGLAKNASLVGITTQYPKYQEREGAVVTLEERINQCMVRSLNGNKLEYDGEDMRSIIAYLTYISQDIPVYKDIYSDKEESSLEFSESSIDHGEKLYAEKNCLSCHAADGSGTGANSGPALWGEGSFNDGASMNRLFIMTDYIQKNMPKDDAGSLTDQEAIDLAAFLLSKERPEWKGHDSDWPHGGKPTDIITKDKRKKIRKGTFDWGQIGN